MDKKNKNGLIKRETYVSFLPILYLAFDNKIKEKKEGKWDETETCETRMKLRDPLGRQNKLNCNS